MKLGGRRGRREGNAGFGAVGGRDDPHAQAEFNEAGIRELIPFGHHFAALQAITPASQL